MKKKTAKKVLVVSETHSREMLTSTSNQTIRSPYLPASEKIPEPVGYIPDSVEAELFDDGELPYLKRVGRIYEYLKLRKIRFEFDGPNEEYEIGLDSHFTNDWDEAESRYLWVDENNHYCYGAYDDILEEYEVLFSSKKISDLNDFLKSMPFIRRGRTN